MSAFRQELGNGRALDLGQGWAGIDNLTEQAQQLQEAQFQQMLELASRYRQTFSTDAGASVLQDLAAMFLFQRIVQPGDSEHAPGIRQGQADVLRRILSMVEFANTGGGRVTGQPKE